MLKAYKYELRPSDEQKRGVSGIYVISNNVNSKVYVGSAVCCKQRLIGHRCSLIKGSHNKRLQNFVDKYGINSLYFTIIEVVEDKNTLLEREQYWIDKYQSFKSNLGYNISKIAGSTLGNKMPDSHKNSCSKRMMGNNLRSGVKWSQQEKDEISKRSVAFWRLNPAKKSVMAKKISDIKKGIPQWHDKDHPMKGKIHPNRKELAVYKDGIFIENILGMMEAAKKYGLDHAAISKVCSGKIKTTKGFTFRILAANNIKTFGLRTRPSTC